MKQTARIISTYTGDTSGVCSALFELGGMTVMHDASGCNSTYNTHDEPRWYDMDSLVFISALTEIEALLGDDSKLVRDVLDAADRFHPRFIALAGTPIPMMTGTDFEAIAREIEEKSGIPTFGFDTDGMHSYVCGAGRALESVARRLCKPAARNASFSVNIIGATPLDFSVKGTVEAMKRRLEEAGIAVHSVWAMNSEFGRIESAAAASVNLVVSSVGIPAAEALRERFGMPYVIGTPCGEYFTKALCGALHEAAGTNAVIDLTQSEPDPRCIIIGESVTACSLAAALKAERGRSALVLSGTECEEHPGCLFRRDEDELLPYLKAAEIIIADPLYRPICPDTARFIALPHEAFSGRIYRDQIPELAEEFDIFCRENQL